MLLGAGTRLQRLPLLSGGFEGRKQRPVLCLQLLDLELEPLQLLLVHPPASAGFLHLLGKLHHLALKLGKLSIQGLQLRHAVNSSLLLLCLFAALGLER